jgi:hypothetical protein
VPALDSGTAVMLLGGLTATASFTATDVGLNLRLTINAPTATVDGTQLAGTGYTSGGSAVTWAAATGTATGAIITNTNTLAWTNGGASNWNIVGMELWDNTPTRKLYGIFAGQPYTIGPGSQFVLAPSSVSVSFP